MAYSAEQRGLARRIVMEAHGGQVTDRSLADVRLALDSASLSISTLHGWIRGSSKAKPVIENRNQLSEISEIETKKSKDEINVDNATVREILDTAFRKYAKRALAQDAVDATPGKDAVASMERLAKLKQLIDGLPTEIIGAANELTELANFFRENNIEMSTAIREWRQKLEARKSSTKVEQSEVKRA